MSLQRYAGVSIRGMTAAVPKNNREMREFLAQSMSDSDVEKVIKGTGIERSRVTGVETTATDLCEHAARALLTDLNLEPSDIDGIVLVTATPDYMAGGSNILQHRLGLSKGITPYDLPNGCNGYVAGLSLAFNMIAAGVSKRVLLCAGETTTKCLRPDDRSTLSLFGDAGSATIIEAKPGSETWYAGYVDGSGLFNIYLPNSGYRKSDEERFLVMKGPEVFEFASRAVPPLAKELLDAAGRGPEEVDFYVLHQASKVIIDFLIRKMRLPPEKVLWSLKNFGNTGSPSIPLTLVANRHVLAETPKKDSVMLCGFGVGWAWGGALVDLSQTHFSKLVEV
jgi:3-oxoacyl-[acyl-carrier-protein] synthase-3